MDMPTLDHRGPEFAELGHAVLAGCQPHFPNQAAGDHLSCSGTGAWEARDREHAVAGDKVLMAETANSRFVARHCEKFKLDVEFLATDCGAGLT